MFLIEHPRRQPPEATTDHSTSYSISITIKVDLHSQLANKAEVSTLIPNVCFQLSNNMFFAPVFLFYSMTYSALKIPNSHHTNYFEKFTIVRRLLNFQLFFIWPEIPSSMGTLVQFQALHLSKIIFQLKCLVRALQLGQSNGHKNDCGWKVH